MHATYANALRLQALRAHSGKVETKVGLVANYDPIHYCVKVTLLPEKLLTGNIPLASSWVGNDWGMYCPPSPGNLIAVTFFDGDINTGYAERCFYNNVDQPLQVESGEFWLVHANGQMVQLTNAGQLILIDGHGAEITLNGDGSITSGATVWNHTGNVNVTGTITATADVVAAGVSLVNHVHSGVSPGGSNTGPPT